MHAAGWSNASFSGSDETGGSPRTSTTTQQPWPADLPSPLSSLPSGGSPGRRSQSRYTASKVGKSDCEGTFAGASGNDEDAPTPDLRAVAPERGGSTRSGRPCGSITSGIVAPLQPLARVSRRMGPPPSVIRISSASGLAILTARRPRGAACAGRTCSFAPVLAAGTAILVEAK